MVFAVRQAECRSDPSAMKTSCTHWQILHFLASPSSSHLTSDCSATAGQLRRDSDNIRLTSFPSLISAWTTPWSQIRLHAPPYIPRAFQSIQCAVDGEE